MHTKRPLIVFTVACVVFLAGEFSLRLIEKFYTVCHFFFGLVAPLALGYFPRTLFKWRGIANWPFNPGWKWCWRWSALSGATCVVLMSFVNEVIDDPKQNGIPFVDAWHHMAADLIGLATFLLLYVAGLRRHLAGPNNSFKPKPLRGSP